MANSKKLDVVSIVIIAVMVVGLILTIVGICTNWLGCTTGGETGFDKLAEMVDDNKTAKDFGMELYNGIDAVNAFAIITIIVTALAAIAYAVSKFVDIKVLKYVVIGVSALAIIFAVLALILTFTCTSTDACKIVKDMGGSFAPAIGCWLLAIGGILGGAAGVYGGLKK